MQTILLVDDDENVLSLVRHVLESSGYKVLEARDAEEACHVERTYAEPIHLLLTDIVMPGRSGPELAKDLTTRRPRMKVLYMSAFTVVDIINQRIQLDPGVPILAKPFSIEGLTKKVRQVLAVSFFARPPRPTST